MFRRLRSRAPVVLLAGSVAAAACTPTPLPTELTVEPASTAPVSAPVVPTAPATDVAIEAEQAVDESAATELRSLRIWMTADIRPDPETPAGQLLAAQLDAFAAVNPNIEIEIRTKGVGGEGGLIDSLRAAAAAARGALPDLIAVGRPVLSTAARDGLLAPLDEQFAAEALTDFYPFGLQQAQIGGQLVGLPFASDAQVLVYSTALYTSPPARWSDILESEGAIVFPAADERSLASVHQYMALGGSLFDDASAGAISLSRSPLQQLFGFYAAARAAELISGRALTASTEADAWAVYRESQAALAVTSAHIYLTERLQVVNTDATIIPTQDGTRFALSETWFFAVANTDATRMPLAVSLLEWLTAPQNMGAWNLQAGYLPPRAAAVAEWPPDAPGAFAAEVLAAAQPMPSSATLAVVGPALAQGVERILRGDITPPAAAVLVADLVAGQ